MRPTVGRIVHVAAGNGHCYAAIVTQVLDDEGERLHLTLFPPNISPYPQRAVPHGAESGAWHWPERHEVRE